MNNLSLQSFCENEDIQCRNIETTFKMKPESCSTPPTNLVRESQMYEDLAAKTEKKIFWEKTDSKTKAVKKTQASKNHHDIGRSFSNNVSKVNHIDEKRQGDVEAKSAISSPVFNRSQQAIIEQLEQLKRFI